ncbi:PrkA family serine protein kinase [Acinetobacter sp.]|uniref:PrkA family serine protein kinase n=1 Tax=Acinetobacter sp. TaxID=472 RepID=UPI00388D5621
MSNLSSLTSSFSAKFATPEVMSLDAYLDLCKTDRMAYASAAERMVAAIGQPKVVDTSEDPRLSRIHSNKKIRVYDAFQDFYGAEDAVERLVAYFRHAAAGLEESKQILYLKGPVGGGKSSIVERLKSLMEKFPIYALYDANEKDSELRTSPVFESPLGLFDKNDQAHAALVNELGIPANYIGNTVLSGWALQKLQEFEGDITKFSVVKLYPNKDRQVGVMKVEPGDENNQDVSVLIGKTDLRKLEKFPQNHPYAYSYSGGLNRTNQGMMDFAEMFKANIKTLNPLLMATQEHNYNGTEAIPAMPYTGIIVAHSNESEWFAFKNNKTNEAFLDRVFIVDVPYCLRVDEEMKIYEKMLKGSNLRSAPIAPGTLKMLAQWMILTRLKEPENSTLYAKLRVYNGENVKDTMPNAKPYEEYRDNAGVDEGMNGMSTRFGFKILSSVFDLRPEETQANPIDLMFVIEEAIRKEALVEEKHQKYLDFIKSFLQPKYFEFLEKELRTAYLESYSSFGQNMFERYVLFAEAWINDEQCRDPETHTLLNRETLNGKLEEIEKAAAITNAKDFRNEIVHYVLRYKAKHEGNSPRWDQYEKIKTVIEKRMFSATEQILPVIAFGPKQDKETEEKHQGFVKRMVDKGYTTHQIKILVSWFTANRKAS